MTHDIPIEANSEDFVDRGESGLRILTTLLFFVIFRVTTLVLGVLIFFQLIYALITRREPGEEVQRFANRALGYMVHIVRYLTWQERRAPFPFQEFPAELDLSPAEPGRPDAD